MTHEYNTRCLTPDFANFCLTLDVSSINSKEINTYIHMILCIKDEKYEYFSIFIKAEDTVKLNLFAYHRYLLFHHF